MPPAQLPPPEPLGACGHWGLGAGLAFQGLLSPLHPRLIRHQFHLRPSGTLTHTFPPSSPPPTGPGPSALQSPPPHQPSRLRPPTQQPKERPPLINSTPASAPRPCLPRSLPVRLAPLSLSQETSYPQAPLQQGCPGPHLNTQLGWDRHKVIPFTPWEDGQIT